MGGGRGVGAAVFAASTITDLCPPTKKIKLALEFCVIHVYESCQFCIVPVFTEVLRALTIQPKFSRFPVQN